jgi:hypothetical protein
MHALFLEVEEAVEFLRRRGQGGERVWGGRRWRGRGDGEVGVAREG